MDKTELVKKVANLFRVSGYKVDISVEINHREIDIRAEEMQGLVRKIILVECADYSRNVGIAKLQEDLLKLRSAKEKLKDSAIVMHVARMGYTPDAIGYALENGVSTFCLEDLEAKLINFDAYIESVENEQIRQIILREYQPNSIHYERQPSKSQNSMKFLDEWLQMGQTWLTLLGDYGVGKSWTLKRYLYHLIDINKKNPTTALLPFFIPLQRFTKAFDYDNLIIRTFQLYGLSGVHISAFEYLMHQGKILFLFDSFDEMAQHLSRDIIRENLNELLVGISKYSRAIMTSRPNYFESRAERLLLIEKDGNANWHQLDKQEFKRHNIISQAISSRLSQSQFARINDLSIGQRKNLFKLVLGADSPAYKELIQLFKKFQELENISQRAVIARLLTTVAETLATSKEVKTIEGYDLLPEDLHHLNQAKVFEIVIYNLLYRDQNIGALSASNRLLFLRSYALYLQRISGEYFAGPDEIRELVKGLFQHELRRTDTPEQFLENYYRTCRRHSGLTTEGQFLDSSGNIDFPVDELDTESRVGFSHNSLREYLVADTIVDFIMNDTHYPGLASVSITELIAEFVVLRAEYEPKFVNILSAKYLDCQESRLKEILFNIIYKFIHKDPEKYVSLLGPEPIIQNLDLSGLDLSGLPLRNVKITGCIAMDTDLRKSDLRKASFKDTIVERVMLDEALLDDADFRETEIISIYVFDQFTTQTTSVLKGKDSRQWLYSNNSKVYPTNDLNPLMGKHWYEAAREVMRTLERRIAGTHQDVSLSKGTKVHLRKFAKEFVNYLMTKNILIKAEKSKTGPGWVVKVNPDYRKLIHNFSVNGTISPELEPFFKKHLPADHDIDLTKM